MSIPRTRVLVDWDGSGEFDIRSNGNDLPNLITDPIEMRASHHEFFNGAEPKYFNLLTSPTRPDYYNWASGGDPSPAPDVVSFYDASAPSGWAVKVNLKQATVSTGNVFDYGYNVGQFSGQVPRASDKLTYASPVTNTLTDGTYTFRAFVKAGPGTGGFDLRVRLLTFSTLIGDTSYASISETEWTEFEGTATVVGTDNNVNFRFEIDEAGQDAHEIIVSGMGIYEEAPAVDFIGNEQRQGVYPLIDEVTDYGERAVEVRLGTDPDAGYRCYMGPSALPTLEVNTTYSFVIWVRKLASSSNADLVMTPIIADADYGGFSYITEVTDTGTAITPWRQYSVTFNTPVDLDTLTIGFELAKDNDATDATIQITGWMVLRHSDSYYENNLLPERIEGWSWNDKYLDVASEPYDFSTPFEGPAWRVVDDTATRPIEMAGAIDGLLTEGETYLFEVWEKMSNRLLSSGSDGDQREVDVSSVSLSQRHATSYLHQIGDDLWKRHQVIFEAGFDVTGQTAHTDGDQFAWTALQSPIGSVWASPRLYQLDFTNVIPDPTTLTVTATGTNTGAANLDGQAGNYYRFTDSGGTGDVTFGAVGEIPVSSNGARYTISGEWDVEINPFNHIEVIDNNGAVLLELDRLTAGQDSNKFVGTFTTLVGTTSIRLYSDSFASTATRALENVWITPFWEARGWTSTPDIPEEWNKLGAGDNLVGVDDISQYVTGFDTSSGKNDFDTPVAFEGIATITLNNDSRYFSPANTASPFYGRMVENLKVAIQLQNNAGSWVTVWTGLTQAWQVKAGTAQSRTATLTCQQGLFRLQAGEFIPGPQEDTTVDVVVSQLVTRSGWVPLVGNNQARLNDLIIGVNAQLRDSSGIFADIDTGIYNLELVGDNWSRKTTLLKALEDVIRTENGHLWVDRNGQLVLRNREHFTNRADDYDYAVTLDTDVHSANYRRSQDLINRVEVSMQPKKEVTDAEVWQTKAPIAVDAGNGRRPAVTEIELDFQFEEGTPRTVNKVYSLEEGSTITVFTQRRIRRQDTNQQMSAADVEKYISVQIIDSEDGGKSVQISSTFRQPVYVSLLLKGDYIEAGDKETYVFDDEDAIEETGTIYKKVVNSNVISTEAEAEAIAAYILSRRSRIQPEFDTIDLVLHSDDDWDNALNWAVGTTLSLSETQTAESSIPHAIIQENFRALAGQVSVNYKLAFLDPADYVVVGTGVQTNKLIYI